MINSGGLETFTTPGGLHGKRILLIDETATNGLILRETLQAWGLKREMCRTPAEALAHLCEEMAGEQPYSLIIIDECMPGMCSFDAAAEMRRIAGSLPIVMLGFDAKPGNATRRAEAGLSGYAVKPVAHPLLLRIVCNAMAVREYPEPRPVEGVDSREKEPVKPARLLVAEDSPDNRLLVRAFLKSSPYHLTFEEDGKAAVDRLATTDFDLILMDVRMPVMDGLDATRAIRAIERERGSAPIPIIALTANASLEDVERSCKAGCNAHLSKPISRLELLSAIEKYRRQVKPVDVA